MLRYFSEVGVVAVDYCHAVVREVEAFVEVNFRPVKFRVPGEWRDTENL